MPEEKKDLIDVGETEGAEINLDDKGEFAASHHRGDL